MSESESEREKEKKKSEKADEKIDVTVGERRVTFVCTAQ